MSAFMCGRAHWSALAEVLSHDDPEGRSPAELYDLLAATNKESIDYRYANGIEGDPDYMYDHTDPFEGGYRAPEDTRWNPSEIKQLVDCYTYQSCEHPGWETSEAHDLCDRLSKTVKGVPGLSFEAPGWWWDLSEDIRPAAARS